MKDVRRCVEVLLGLRLIAENAVREIGDVESGKGVDGMCKQSRMLIGIVEIGDCDIDKAGSAGAKVGCDGRKFFRVTRNKEEARTLRGPDAAGRLGDT
jgi:hypothetical protein